MTIADVRAISSSYKNYQLIIHHHLHKLQMAAVAVINFPALNFPSLRQQDDLALDPAQLALLDAEEAKKRRKREETRIELEKIHGRIRYTLNEFEGLEPEDEGEEAEAEAEAAERREQRVEERGNVIPSVSSVDFALIDDPLVLYEMLADSRMRAKYYNHITLFVIGCEEQRANREAVLQSLHDFFSEMQAGSMQQVLEEVATEEIDFDDATAGLETALQTAQSAAERLLEIRSEMGKLIAIASSYPDTKKGRKKMEKALLKAQEEVDALSNTLRSVQGDLDATRDKCTSMQKNLEAKTTECAKLRKTADQVKKLQAANDSLKAELESTRSALQKAQTDLEQIKNKPSSPPPPLAPLVVERDAERLHELETSLSEQTAVVETLKAKVEAVEERWRGEMEQAREKHVAEVAEMRARFEEQLKSLAGEGEELFADIEGGEEEKE